MVRVSFSFSPKGRDKMILYGLLGGGRGGGKCVLVCKACGKLGGSGGKLPWEILILDLSQYDGIWDCFAQT